VCVSNSPMLWIMLEIFIIWIVIFWVLLLYIYFTYFHVNNTIDSFKSASDEIIHVCGICTNNLVPRMYLKVTIN